LSTDISKFLHKGEQVSTKKSKSLTSYLNGVGIVLAIMEMVYPHPYEVVLTISIIYPLVMLYILYKHRNAMSLEDDGGKKVKAKQPSLLAALTMPSFGLALRAILDYDLLIFKDCFIPWSVISVLISIPLILIVSKSTAKVKLFTNTGYALLAFIVIYSYGSTVIANCMYDNTQPEIYRTLVLSKHPSGSKHRRYYLKLDKWGHHTEPEDVSVATSLYDETQVGDWVYVYVKKGTLGVPWYYVDR